jgi:hypothetical protein
MYTTNFVYKAPLNVLESLKKLYLVIQAEKVHFDHAITIVQSRQLMDTLVQFLQQCNQYQNELKCQIESVGGNMEEQDSSDVSEPVSFMNSKDIYEYCIKCEKKILSAYREFLNQPIMDHKLRGMVRYQLNNLLCAFLQFRILRDAFVTKSFN